MSRTPIVRPVLGPAVEEAPLGVDVSYDRAEILVPTTHVG
jgi:hypothetical protein